MATGGLPPFLAAMPHVVIPDAKREIVHLAQSGAGPFSFDFVWFQKPDLRVYVNGGAIGQNAFTATPRQTLDGGYVGGTVTLATAVSNATVVIAGATRPGRTDDIPIGGAKPQRLNSEYDKIHAALLDLETRVERSPQFLPGALAGPSLIADEPANVGKVIGLEEVPGSNPPQRRFAMVVNGGERGEQGPIGLQGPPGPPLNFIGTLANSGQLPDPSTTPTGTAYLINGELWVRAANGTWVNTGAAAGRLDLLNQGNLALDGVTVIDFVGSGVTSVEPVAPGVARVRIDAPGGGALGVLFSPFVESWSEASPTIQVDNAAGAGFGNVLVFRNGRALNNDGDDWTPGTNGAHFRATVHAAEDGDDVFAMVLGAQAAGGAGTGATIHRQSTAPVGVPDGDVWIDTGNSNAPFLRVAGAWVSIRDGAIGALETRATSLESRATSLETRATSIEGVNTSQASAITALQSADVTLTAAIAAAVSVNNTQNGRLDALEASPGADGFPYDALDTFQNKKRTLTIPLAGSALTLKMHFGQVVVAANTIAEQAFLVPFADAGIAYFASCAAGTTGDVDNISAGVADAPNELTRIRIVNGGDQRTIYWMAMGI